MAKVVGIGGIFMDFKGEQEVVQRWYEKHLGLLMGQYGAGFIEGDQLAVLTFKDLSEGEAARLNLRVDDMQVMIDHLRQENCEIVSDIAEYPYGLFAQFKDPFGNIIELWQAYEEEYRAMVRDEVKRYKNEKDDQ